VAWVPPALKGLKVPLECLATMVLPARPARRVPPDRKVLPAPLVPMESPASPDMMAPTARLVFRDCPVRKASKAPRATQVRPAMTVLMARKDLPVPMAR
jgi:hypothetical protein